MHSLKYQLYTAAEIRSIEDRAMRPTSHQGMGLSGYTLMQRAGEAAFEQMLQHWPETCAVSVICGKGNNAGDGYIVARLACQFGMRVQLIALASPEILQGDARTAFEDFVAVGGVVAPAGQAIEHALVVDALLGTGFRPPLRDPYVDMICRINESSAAVLALDVPSGVDPDTGAVSRLQGDALAVRASITVSFIGRKIGLYTGAAKAFVGELRIADLGIADASRSISTPTSLLTWQYKQLPTIALYAHKHQRGKVVIIGGDLGMGGAVLLAAEAALRCGAGLVSVVTQAEHRTALLARLPEAMFIDSESADLGQTLDAADFMVIGPGMGRRAWGAKLFALAAAAATPKLIDADGLYWLAKAEERPLNEIFITPHSGEAAKLLDVDVSEIEADRLNAGSKLAQRYACNVVVKGPGSVVVTRQGAQICAHGGPAMATAGMGDVLSGVCAGLLAPLYATTEQSLVCDQFAQAVALHSASADLAAQELGPHSVLATDVTVRIPTVLAGKAKLNG